MWSVHRETPSYLTIRHLDVVNDLGSAYYWNAPEIYLGNKVRADKRIFLYYCIPSVLLMIFVIFVNFFAAVLFCCSSLSCSL